MKIVGLYCCEVIKGDQAPWKHGVSSAPLGRWWWPSGGAAVWRRWIVHQPTTTPDTNLYRSSRVERGVFIRALRMQYSHGPGIGPRLKDRLTCSVVRSVNTHQQSLDRKQSARCHPPCPGLSDWLNDLICFVSTLWFTEWPYLFVSTLWFTEWPYLFCQHIVIHWMILFVLSAHCDAAAI